MTRLNAPVWTFNETRGLREGLSRKGVRRVRGILISYDETAGDVQRRIPVTGKTFILGLFFISAGPFKRT